MFSFFVFECTYPEYYECASFLFHVLNTKKLCLNCEHALALVLVDFQLVYDQARHAFLTL